MEKSRISRRGMLKGAAAAVLALEETSKMALTHWKSVIAEAKRKLAHTLKRFNDLSLTPKSLGPHSAFGFN